MLDTWWNSDLLDIIAGVQEKLRDKNKMELHFLLMPVKEIQACAATTGTRLKYIVAVTQGLRDRVFEDTNIKSIFDRSLKEMKSIHNCSDDLIFLRKVLCITTWMLIVGHELGHVVNGHLGDGAALRSMKQEVFRLGWAPGDPITDEMRIDSVIENDADGFSGNWAGIWPSRLQLACASQEDKDNLGMSLTSMAAHYIVTLLNSLGDGYPSYPPNSIRVLTMTSAFLHSYQHAQNTGQLLDVDHKVDVDALQDNETYQTAIREIDQDLTAAGYPRIPFDESTMKEWLQTYKDFLHVLKKIHDDMWQVIGLQPTMVNS